MHIETQNLYPRILSNNTCEEQSSHDRTTLGNDKRIEEFTTTTTAESNLYQNYCLQFLFLQIQGEYISKKTMN